jgi:hypothetical protein
MRMFSLGSATLVRTDRSALAEKNFWFWADK